MLKELGIEITSHALRQRPDMMANLINEKMRNPYAEKLRSFHYENCVRELLFLHLAQNKTVIPGELLDKDINMIYKTDSLIAANLQKHYTIDELSRMSGTNKLKLKLGFKKLCI